MRNLGGLVINEWLKLSKRRGFLIPYLLLAALPAVVGYIIHSSSPEAFGSGSDYAANLLTPQGFGQAAAMLAVIGASGAVAREFSQGTVKFLLIRSRSRNQILLSKLIAVILYGMSLVAVTTAAALASGALLFGMRQFGQSLTEAAAAAGYSAVYTLVYLALSFMLGVVTRSSGATIGITLFAIALDKLTIARDAYKYFLFPNLDLSVYASGGAPLPGMTTGFSAAMLCLYTAVFLIAGFAVFARRDVA